METVIEILEDIKSGIDYESCTTLIDDAIFDSFDIIQTINMLNEEFEISIPASEIIPENFNSAKSLWDMVQKIQDD